MYLIDKLSEEKISEKLNIPLDKIQKATKRFKSNKSNIELSVGSLLHEIYPKYKITAQLRIGNLYLDYYIEDIRLAVEVDGIQHSKITPFFHGRTKLSQQINFDNQVENDAKKGKLVKEQIYISSE